MERKRNHFHQQKNIICSGQKKRFLLLSDFFAPWLPNIWFSADGSSLGKLADYALGENKTVNISQ